MLRHLLTSAARTSSRSLFTKPNASVSVSSLRTLSDQRESMLRHIYTSAARTSSRSLFAKSSAPVYVSSHRTFSDQKESTGQKTFSQTPPFWLKLTFCTIVLGTALFGLPWLMFHGQCRIEFNPDLDTSHSEPVDAAALSIKNSDPFKGAKVYSTVNPWVNKHNTYLIQSNTLVMLPNIRDHSVKEIYDGLKLRGIDVECSEEGVHRGLMKYTLKQMHDGAEKHIEKKCECGNYFAKASSNAQPLKKPDLLEGARVKLTVNAPVVSNQGAIHMRSSAKILLPNTDYNSHKEICDALKLHGIDVECSEEGVRRGLITYALKQKLEKLEKHLKMNCECGYFSAVCNDSSEPVDAAAQSIKKPDVFVMKDGWGRPKKCTCGYFTV